MSESGSPRARVILSATCYADAEATLHLAVILAREVGAGLHGLLVSDEAILAAAGHPHARAVSRSGRAVTEVTVETMRAAFRADARLFEKRLIEAARGAMLDTGFSATGGRLPNVLAQFASASDFVVVGFRRAIHDGDALVLVLGDRGAEAAQLILAQHLSAALRKRLVVVVTSRHYRDVASVLARHGRAGDEVLPYLGTAGLLADLERMSPAALIIATAQAELPPVAALIDAARCPVILTVPEEGRG